MICLEGDREHEFACPQREASARGRGQIALYRRWLEIHAQRVPTALRRRHSRSSTPAAHQRSISEKRSPTSAAPASPSGESKPPILVGCRNSTAGGPSRNGSSRSSSASSSTSRPTEIPGPQSPRSHRVRGRSLHQSKRPKDVIQLLSIGFAKNLALKWTAHSARGASRPTWSSRSAMRSHRPRAQRARRRATTAA